MMVKSTRPPITAGDRLPDFQVHTPAGRQERIHGLCSRHFTALHFSDARRWPLRGGTNTLILPDSSRQALTGH